MPNLGSACPKTCWKGDPSHSFAPKAQCKLVKGHGGPHLDSNGNHFDSKGRVLVIRNKKGRKTA